VPLENWPQESRAHASLSARFDQKYVNSFRVYGSLFDVSLTYQKKRMFNVLLVNLLTHRVSKTVNCEYADGTALARGVQYGSQLIHRFEAATES
jgi:hypothetical protein